MSADNNASRDFKNLSSEVSDTLSIFEKIIAQKGMSCQTGLKTKQHMNIVLGLHTIDAYSQSKITPAFLYGNTGLDGLLVTLRKASDQLPQLHTYDRQARYAIEKVLFKSAKPLTFNAYINGINTQIHLIEKLKNKAIKTREAAPA